MPLSEAQVQSTLRGLVDPNTGNDFVSTRSARNIKLAGDDVTLDIELAYPGKSQHEPLRRQGRVPRHRSLSYLQDPARSDSPAGGAGAKASRPRQRERESDFARRRPR